MSNAKELICHMHTNCKASPVGLSVTYVIEGVTFQAKRHGSQVWFYVDDRRCARAELEQTMQECIDSETANEELPQVKAQFDKAEYHGFEFASVRAPKDGVIVHGLEMTHPAFDTSPVIVVQDEDHIKRVFDIGQYDVVVTGGGGVHITSMFGLQNPPRANLELYLQQCNRVARAYRYVGKAQAKQHHHALVVWREKLDLSSKKQTPNVAKRTKRLFRILRILNL